MTPEELDQIEKRNDRLYLLYNACAKANAHWHSEHIEIYKLMAHLDLEFPGKDVCLLLREVKRLQTIITKAQLPSPSATAGTKQSKPRRTKAEVLMERATVLGCCDRHANNQGCDCLQKAE